ncbi:MAG: hypothetical protein WCA26_22345, partial [Xanthobacteraceae bacterium]
MQSRIRNDLTVVRLSLGLPHCGAECFSWIVLVERIDHHRTLLVRWLLCRGVCRRYRENTTIYRFLQFRDAPVEDDPRVLHESVA